MFEFLKVLEIILAILVIIVVLIQNKNVTLNLSSMGGGMGAVTKRGPEKVLFIATIIIGSAFVLNSVLFFLLY